MSHTSSKKLIFIQQEDFGKPREHRFYRSGERRLRFDDDAESFPQFCFVDGENAALGVADEYGGLVFRVGCVGVSSVMFLEYHSLTILQLDT